MNEVNEKDFVEALIQLKPFLRWANQANKAPRNLDGWAVRQALLTALEFMAFHQRQQGIPDEEIRKFDLLAYVEAKNTARELSKRC